MNITKILKSWNRRRNEWMKQLRLKACSMHYGKPERFGDTNIKKVLLLRFDHKIGDTVVASCLFAPLKKQGYEIYVLAGTANAALLDGHPLLSKVFVTPEVDDIDDNLMHILQNEHFDLLIDTSDFMDKHRLRLIHQMGAANNLGVNKAYLPIFNLNIEAHDIKEHHISKRYIQVLQRLNCPVPQQIGYTIFIPEAVKQNVAEWRQSLGESKLVVLNYLAATYEKTMNKAQLKAVLDFFKPQTNIQLVLLNIHVEIPTEQYPRLILNPFHSITEACALIETADAVITPDTSIVHISTAFNKPTLALYPHANLLEWHPNNPQSICVSHEECVPEIDISSILNGLQKLMQRL